MEEELGRLESALRSHIPRIVVVKGIRRTGKSSLMRVAPSDLDPSHILIDLRLEG